jgi:hypothetical protein
VIEPGDGFRLGKLAGDRGAAFCRLEHVVPWAMQGAHWGAGEPHEPSGAGRALDLRTCSSCGAALDEGRLVLVRHRGEHRIPDGFCSVAHLLDWAKAGGRWQK